jgi:hypothetical protein
MKTPKLIVSIVTASLACVVVHAQYHMYDTWEENYSVQALLGAVKFDDLKFKDTSGSGDATVIDISTLPQLGGAWTTQPQIDQRLQYGLEASFLLGFRFDKVNYASIGGSGLYVNISTSMWMFDLAGGGYANLFLTEGGGVRVYAGGGPLMMYADYDSSREETGAGGGLYETSESAFGLGVYARTGIEFRVHEKGMLGLGARGTWADVDLSDVGGSSELTGIAAFVTYTAGF